jgi:hypothetical protein
LKRPRIKTNEGPPDKFVQIVTHVVDRPDSTYPVVINPYKLDLSQFGEKVRSEIEFKIKNVSTEDLSLSLISSAKDYFKVELPDKIGAGKTETAKVTLTKKGETDAFDKSLTFELSDKEKSRFTVPVKRTLHTAPGAPTADHSRAP